jgi:hypothetical protein
MSRETLSHKVKILGNIRENLFGNINFKIFLLIYALFSLNESHWSYIKFQRELKKIINKTLVSKPPDRTAEAVIKEFSEFKIDKSKCPKNFILIPEITNPNTLPIRQVADYSFNPCLVKIEYNVEILKGSLSETLILGIKDSVANIIFSYDILQTSENYILFREK